MVAPRATNPNPDSNPNPNPNPNPTPTPNPNPTPKQEEGDYRDDITAICVRLPEMKQES